LVVPLDLLTEAVQWENPVRISVILEVSAVARCHMIVGLEMSSL